jgi:hypothetical protein
MKNIFKFISVIAFALLLTLNLIINVNFNKKGKYYIELENSIALAMAVTVPNTATCYSTYSGGLLNSTIWVCGSCVQTKASRFSDSGICNF